MLRWRLSQTAAPYNHACLPPRRSSVGEVCYATPAYAMPVMLRTVRHESATRTTFTEECHCAILGFRPLVSNAEGSLMPMRYHCSSLTSPV